MADKGAVARELFMSGCNCAQSVFCAFHEELGLTRSEALKLSSAFGGGMGGLREVCGAVSGMLMAMGGLIGYDEPGDDIGKRQYYAEIQQLAGGMSERYGTIICRELLALNSVEASKEPSERTEEYYKERPCMRYVEACARLLEEKLGNS